MPVSLTHISEEIVACMANRLPKDFLDLCGLRERADRDYVDLAEKIAYVEVPLCPYSGKSFDGAHCVDVVVMLSQNLGVPFELKLGNTRLTKSRIDREWLNGCSLSHGGTRLKGSMMSILERKGPDSSTIDDLRVRLVSDRQVRLTEEWFVIARSNVLEGWAGAARPAFSSRVRLLSIECIIECFGGKEKFNDMVHELLCFDYYDSWMAEA